MDDNSILNLMIKDHEKIINFINEIESKGHFDIDLFSSFKWHLEKHIFTEEKAIFTSYSPEDVIEGYKMLPELTKQHNYIVNTLKNWRDDIRKKRTLSDIYSFKEFIIRHKEFEEQKVYPQLDEGLNEEQKGKIIAKINEIM